VTTESQAEINPETNAVLMQLNLSISGKTTVALGIPSRTVIREYALVVTSASCGASRR
jgi:hypothetical protein